MSNRSYPADFSRPLREVPVATDEDVQRMLARLRRRCKVGKVSVNDSSAESCDASGLPELDASGLPDGAKPSAPAVANLAPASSAGPSLPAGALVVSGAAEITATAGGGSNGIEHGLSLPFQPTRPVPINGSSSSGPVRDVHDSGGLGDVQTNAGADPACSPLQWERVASNAMRTTCGTWTCSKVTVMAKTSYELWRRIAGLERPMRVLQPFRSFDLAARAAQDEMDRDDT